MNAKRHSNAIRAYDAHFGQLGFPLHIYIQQSGGKVSEQICPQSTAFFQQTLHHGLNMLAKLAVLYYSFSREFSTRQSGLTLCSPELL